MVKNPPAIAGAAVDCGSIPGSGKSPGEGNGYPHQYSCLENSMGQGALQVTVHGVSKSQTRLSTHTHTHRHTHRISDSSVGYEGSSISSKAFLPTVVDIMVIWIKFSYSCPF